MIDNKADTEIQKNVPIMPLYQLYNKLYHKEMKSTMVTQGSQSHQWHWLDFLTYNDSMSAFFYRDSYTWTFFVGDVLILKKFLSAFIPLGSSILNSKLISWSFSFRFVFIPREAGAFVVYFFVFQLLDH